MRTTMLSAALVLMLALPAASDDKPQTPAAAGGEFKGKALTITLKDRSGAYLEEVQVKTIGGRSFLVGKGVGLIDGDNFYEGRSVWVSAEDVVQIVVFDRVADMKKSLAQPPGKDAAPLARRGTP